MSSVTSDRHLLDSRNRSRSITCAKLALSCAALLTTLAALTACGNTILSPSDERSPFDRYDAMRSQHAPQYVENEFGRREPNLRGRLAPKE